MYKFACLVVGTVAALLGSNPATAGRYNAVLNIGDPMPSFQDLPTTDGTALSATEIDEAIVVMVSLANHCPWVKGMDADLVALVKTFQGHSVRIIGLSVNRREDDRLPAMAEHARKVGYNFTYVYDESQDLGRALGATRTPEYFVFDAGRKLIYMGLLYNSPAKLDRDGTVRHVNGEPTEFYVHDAVLAGLAGKQITTAETRAHGCTVVYDS